MRVFISSTPDQLEPQRQAAADIVRELGHQPLQRDPAPRRGLDPVTACDRQVARADAVLAIVGWRRDRVPAAEAGGDGLRPWSYWQVRGAFEHGVPVVALLAGELFAREPREQDPEARAVVADLRGELARIAAVFGDDADFRRRLRAGLRAVERDSQSPEPTPVGGEEAELGPRRFPVPELPPRPYPLLLPYAHPDLMAGRDGDLSGLRRVLRRPVTVVGLHAASGTGKSSLLAGGLVPALRAEGRPVAFVRHPAEAGLTERLLGDLLETGEGGTFTASGDARQEGSRLVDRLVVARRLAGGATPVLVIDQLEDLFKDGAEAPRALQGMLLAASTQRLPGTGGPACRWLLAYRQEYHGRLVEWLEDVLRDARALGFEGTDTLPHDLSGPARFIAWPLRPLAASAGGADDPAAAAARVFLDAIEKPLRLRRPSPPATLPEGEGSRKAALYPWTFAPGHAERLARAFAEARVRRPDAPLVPELQVVLAHLLEQAGEPIGDQTMTVEVPEEPAELIEEALEEHLRRALDIAFPQGLAADLDEAARAARTRALLVLRELADVHGRREHGHAADALARALGEQGREVLEKLSTPRTRLVLLERHSGSWVYLLAHDRLAEVLVEVVDDGGWAGFGVDAELLGLRRFVTLQSQLHASGDAAQATAVPPGHFGKIKANKAILLWTDSQRAWWRACRARRRVERRRRLARRAVATVVVAGVAFGAWTLADRRARRRALLEEVAAAEPEAAFAALDRLTLEKNHDREELVDRLRAREEPFDVFEHGLGGVGEERRAEVLVRVAELALPILESSPEDPKLIACLVWALDFFAARDLALIERASTLRDQVLGPLRRSRPPPPRPAPGDPSWADIPAGSFWMGAGASEGFDDAFMLYSKPRHRVAISTFRIMTHEITNAEYRRLFPGHQGAGDLPAVSVNWYHAYAYAAWRGGRLPTEAEWEYAARAGCGHIFCKRGGSMATLDEVAWWLDNSVDPETGESSVKRIVQLEANPWGLWDMYGNAMEWTANWFGAYGETLETDPPGPTDTPLDHRALRGGSARHAGESISASRRSVDAPHALSAYYGLRVVRTIPRRASGATD